MGRGMTRRWGKRINPMTAPALLSERTMQLMLTPLHMAVELLPLGHFGREHADHVAKIINVVAMDPASKGNGMLEVADEAGQILLAMKARVDAGKSWNCTAAERERLTACILKMDKYMRTWTNRRFTIAAMTVDAINRRRIAEGAKFLERTDIPA